MPKQKKRVPNQAYEHFIFEIGDWAPEYSFGTDQSYHATSLYSDHALLTIAGSCMFPSRFVGRTTSIRLAGERDIQNPSYLKYD